MTCKPNWMLCAMMAATLLPLLLTGCAQESAANRRIYQPSTLRPTAGQQIQTPDGYYITGEDEVWHSDIRFRDLENAYLNSNGK